MGHISRRNTTSEDLLSISVSVQNILASCWFPSEGKEGNWYIVTKTTRWISLQKDEEVEARGQEKGERKEVPPRPFRSDADCVSKPLRCCTLQQRLPRKGPRV